MGLLYQFARGGLLAFLLLLCAFAYAQHEVTGTVTDGSDGSSLPGVNILEKGTSNGTATDAEGHFSITVSDNAILVFTFVGYATQEVSVGSQSTINVTLASDVTALNEVVVTGYGSQEKKEITGSVTAIDSKDFNKGFVNDPTQLIQGKVAGLSIYNRGGDPNADPVIRLRGLNTVGSNAQPLVVVDGVPGASLQNIDPNDIATMSVLKDGSAAAIYGSRASSGVILITTKKGSATDKTSVEFNSYVSSSSIAKKIPIMTAAQYVAAGGNDLGSSTDWIKQCTQNGLSAVNNLAVSGASANSTFRVSINTRNVQGIEKKSGFDQVNTRANFTHSALNNKLRFDMNMAFTNRNEDLSFPEVFRYAALFNPTAPIFFPNGEYYQAILFDNYNPVAILNQNTHTGKRENLNYSARVDYDIIPSLTLTGSIAQEFNNSREDIYYSSKSLWNNGVSRHGIAAKTLDQNRFTVFDGYGTYLKSFGSTDFTLTAGYEYVQSDSSEVHVQVGNFPSDELGGNALELSQDRVFGGQSNVDISSGQSPIEKDIAGFARVNFVFGKSIYLNASVRREGSSKLGADHRWGTFPAVGAGVDLNHYLNFGAFSQLKLRVGYGVTGSLPGGSGYGQDLYTYSFDGSVTKARDANPDLKWEQKGETDAGIDFTTGKLDGTVDVYHRSVKDFILLYTPDPVNNPQTKQYKNFGNLATNGFEVTLNYGVTIGSVHWTPGLTVSHYLSTLKSWVGADTTVRADFGSPGQNGTSIIKLQVGSPIGIIWGPVFAGVNDNGSPAFADLNGDGTVDANPADALLKTADFKQLGKGIPTLEMGWANTISVKHWDFNVFFRGAFGHSLVNQFRAFYEPIDPGAINSYNRISTSKAVPGLTFSQYSSLYVEKADFVKLDNATIGYSFNFNSGAVKSLRLYVSGQNLFTITGYTGIDPEPALVDTESSNDVLAPGIDRRNTYYTSRTYTFGLNLGL